MTIWTKEQYGICHKYPNGRWSITNGHLKFDVHFMMDGSGNLKKYPYRWIVTPNHADIYADRILAALNAYPMDLS